ILAGLSIDFIRSSLIILGWSIFFFMTNRWLWRKGLKHYSGMGA
ncbi:MAG: multidrug ABC transporter permease, partial [Xenococcaceae cyanobacterium]